ncbi:hypothetical protein D6D00_08731 [Aureobasidium pullulans]|nr:hypothetical protein D6D00_08731 [Aureobasidium pullulans]
MTCYFGQQSCALLRTSRYCSSAGFVVESSLAIQKSLTSSLKQDLNSNDRSCDVSETLGEPQSRPFGCTRTSLAGREKRKMLRPAGRGGEDGSAECAYEGTVMKMDYQYTCNNVVQLEAMHEIYKTQIRSISQHCDMREYQMANMIKSRRYYLRDMSDIKQRLAPLLLMHDGAVGNEKLWLHNHCRQLERENEAVTSELQKAKAELEALKDYRGEELIDRLRKD